MNFLPEELKENINTINKYFNLYHINNYYFSNTIKELKYIENYTLDKYGMYDARTNRITVNPHKEDNGKKVLSHELLHIAGGFSKHVGFNEFSTQYLNSVIFGAKKGHFEKNDFYMIDKLVSFVSLDTFFCCYLLRNFELFMSELEKHFDYSTSYTLINILDKYYYWYTDLTGRSGLNKLELEKSFKKLIKTGK